MIGVYACEAFHRASVEVWAKRMRDQSGRSANRIDPAGNVPNQVQFD
jgi:hypothetical protein